MKKEYEKCNFSVEIIFTENVLTASGNKDELFDVTGGDPYNLG